MTLTVFGYVIAGLVLAGGIIVALRRRGSQRVVLIAAAIVLAGVIGWFAWLAGTAA